MVRRNEVVVLGGVSAGNHDFLYRGIIERLRLTGGAPGTIRALIMATMRALAVCRGQRYDPLTSLSAAALIMTLVNPLRTLTASFQFSFFVVLGILLLAKDRKSTV